MTSSDAQKSEVHDTTDDSMSSPAYIDQPQRGAEKLHAPQGEVRPASISLRDATIVRDDTDIGGPLVIESADPELNPPHVPIDPFPTNATPETDPPVESRA